MPDSQPSAHIFSHPVLKEPIRRMASNQAKNEQPPHRRSLGKILHLDPSRRVQVAPGGPFQESYFCYDGDQKVPWELLEGYLESKWPGFRFAGQKASDTSRSSEVLALIISIVQ